MSATAVDRYLPSQLPALDIRLSRLDRVYAPGDVAHGMLIVLLPPRQHVSHTGLAVTAAGLAEVLHPRAGPRTTPLLSEKLVDVPEGKLVPDEGTSNAEVPIKRFPFKFKVPGEARMETYHGQHANVTYAITGELKRGMFSMALTSTCEFIVETKGVPRPPAPSSGIASDGTKSLQFAIRAADQERLPTDLRQSDFEFAGTLSFTTCAVNFPLEGELHVVHRPPRAVQEVVLVLMRVEKLGETSKNEQVYRTPVVYIQAAEGDFAEHGSWPIPLLLVFPRLFCCPDINHVTFRVRFELDVIITFAPSENDKKDATPVEAKTSIPLTLYRLSDDANQ